MLKNPEDQFSDVEANKLFLKNHLQNPRRTYQTDVTKHPNPLAPEDEYDLGDYDNIASTVSASLEFTLQYLTRRISRSDLLLFRSRFPSFSLHAQAYQDDRNEDEEMYEEDHAQVDQAGDEDEAD